MTATVIPMNPPDPKCSFCATPQSKSRYFFGTGMHHICGDCVVKAKARMEEEPK